MHFTAKIQQPMRFEAGKNLKIIIELDPETNYLQQLETAIEIFKNGEN